MGIETIEFKGERYPKYLTNGNSARFVRGFVDEICKADYDKGEFGYNVGAGPKAWNYPEKAIPIDLAYKDGYDALNLPKWGASYICAFHLLEHTERYVEVLEYWYNTLKEGGTVLLYLPHPDQKYWDPVFNRKHFHIFYPKDIAKTLVNLGFKNVFHSERDLYWGFLVVGEK
jgi:hypothetical protein